MATLLLFDIDLTMVKTGGAGLRAMTRALSDYTGYNGPVVSVRPDGKTDPIIVPQLFAENQLPYKPEDYEPFMKLYVSYLDQEQQQAQDWILLPGVRELLQRIEATEDLYLALVTGNDERGARLKLTPFDLNRYFPVGGFASDSAIRADLIPIAIRRATRYYGVSFGDRDAIILGDSVGDVRCADDNGLRCLAVTTGMTTEAELKAAGPCTVLENLSDTEQVLSLLQTTPSDWR